MKEKFLDINVDWETIKETQLNFLLEENVSVAVGMDARTAGTEDADKKKGGMDPREAMLKNLVRMA